MTPMSEDGGPLREWSPLTHLLQQIPIKLQNGIFTQDIIFTCIDVIPEFIAIGTNCGIVYWFDRQSQHLQTLRCENIHTTITCLSVISTVDFMIAAGNNHGIVTLFLIPKKFPNSLPDSLKPKQKKQIERYNISGLHKSSVTAVEWSKNGMTLFSGDQDGLVVLTEIDFYMHLSKSSELLNEKYPVIQLSYQQGFLLISTLFRTILVDKNHNNKVSQVGQKERKILGKLGAVFDKRQTPIQQPIIYATRPGLRLWQADKSGSVLKTHIFKETPQSITTTQVLLLNPAPNSINKLRGEPSFGIILPFCDDLFITYNDEIMHIINPITTAITSVITDLRKIIDVACTKDEIFILEGVRNILRIAYHPESPTVQSMENTKHPLSSFVDYSKPLTTTILGITSKFKETSIVPTIPFYKINPSNIIQAISALPLHGRVDPNPITNAEEATETPPLPFNIPQTPLSTEITMKMKGEQTSDRNNFSRDTDEKRRNRHKIFQQIGQQDFEDVVFTPGKKHEKLVDIGKNKTDISSDNLSSLSTYDIHHTHSSLLTLKSIYDESILNTNRNLESIQKDVEIKEKLLADVLNFDLSKYMTSSQIYSPQSTTNNALNTITYVNCTKPMIESTILNIKQIEPTKQHTYNNSDEDESYTVELKKLENLGECSKNLLQIKHHKISENRFNKVEENKCYQNNGTASRELEIQFNVLSKEFVSSAIADDTEDWVVVSSND